MIKKLEVIFDNGGGVTMQGYKWQCSYNDGTRAGSDAAEILQGANPRLDWDLSPSEYRIAPTWEEIRNGGYQVWDLEDLLAALAWPADEIDERTSWENVKEFVRALQEAFS